MRTLVAAVSLAVVACSVTGPTAGEDFALDLHQRVSVHDTPFEVRFDSVLEDSRCPKNAVCIVPGRAKVRLHLSYRMGPDVLIITDLTSEPDSSTALVNGWFVDYRGLFPVPEVGTTIDPDRRSVRLRIRQAVD